MDNLQLTGSAVFSFDSEIHTLFIASQNGRYGVVEAGSWETVIPFCLFVAVRLPVWIK